MKPGYYFQHESGRLGSFHNCIIGLKTLGGAIRRFNTYEMEAGNYKVFRFTNVYDNSTYTQVATVTK